MLPVVLCFVLLAGSLPSMSVASTQLLPDLGMATLRKFSIENSNGQKRLRFTTIIINIGQGPFQVHGYDKTNGEFRVEQEISDGNGNWTDRQSIYKMYFAGDGHNHWHLRDLESYVLQHTTLPMVRVGEKHGFCFFDNKVYDLDLPGAPDNPGYPPGNCGKITSTQVTTGLSIGWGDRYAAKRIDQFIDITGLPSGTYTLTATADALSDFLELCENNNTTTARLQISGNSVTVLNNGEDSESCV
jgi:hypothetical protein